AEPPSRRAAEPPSRRAAEPPSRREIRKYFRKCIDSIFAAGVACLYSETFFGIRSFRVLGNATTVSNNFQEES
ncbi:hypothetical protein, partial [Propionivibrio dicarboxylicus]|uniref:hypothetical protein n=1 Tax=Propionivibrio dicarboxylicus TaxID=83767 RepID=UPI001C40B352